MSMSWKTKRGWRTVADKEDKKKKMWQPNAMHGPELDSGQGENKFL